ncbi:hypothetical protein ACFOJ6_24980 [Gordonia humi]|uniref:hypothetical protein n=1 Tax=Gordonia humi TaxID=686429 RepID=UPI00361E6A4D
MAVAGFAMIGIFMALVMGKKVVPMVAFIVVPLTFAVAMGGLARMSVDTSSRASKILRRS